MAKKESNQKKLNKKLLKYIFNNEIFPEDKSELKKLICKDNVSFQKSFTNSYKLLEVGKILIDGKLNPELLDIYKIECIEVLEVGKFLIDGKLNPELLDIYKIECIDVLEVGEFFLIDGKLNLESLDIYKAECIDVLVNILINLLHDYQKSKKVFDRYLSTENINDDDEDIQYSKELPEHLEYLNLELAIKDIYNRFIFAKTEEKKHIVPRIKGDYSIKKDIPKSKQTTTELAFRDILDKVLRFEPKTISEKEILNTVQMYYYPNEEYDEYLKKKVSKTKTTQKDKDYAMINAIKNSIITAIEELKIITGENEYLDFNTYRYDSTDNREFNLIKFKDSSWKMNARTKQDTIKSLIGGISDINNVSDANKKHAMFIFDFIG